MKTPKYIAYIRVSTKEQGVSGLGLAAQKAEIYAYVGEKNIVQLYEEVETGTNKRRPRLDEAIRACKAGGYILVVAKLDRLGRNLTHLCQLREDMEILIVARPNMGTLEFSIFAGMAQEESERASARIKAALAAKMATGWKAGSKKGFSASCREGKIKQSHQEAVMSEINIRAKQTISLLLEEGKSYRKIAEWLNKIGEKTPQGKDYNVSSVQRVVRLYDLKGVK